MPLETNEKEYTQEELEFLRQRHKDEHLSIIYRRQFKRLDYLDTINLEEGTLANVKSLSRDILVRLGYGNNYIYTEESYNLLDKFLQFINYIKGGEHYTKELIAVSVVIEVLDYYNAYHSNLMTEYDIDLDTYFMFSNILHKWSVKNYWNPKITF